MRFGTVVVYSIACVGIFYPSAHRPDPESAYATNYIRLLYIGVIHPVDMPSKSAVLICKGDIPADNILEVLESLMKHIPRNPGSEAPVLEPCNVFALICGSGNAAYALFSHSVHASLLWIVLWLFFSAGAKRT
jgi:hypothetical protein